MKKLLLIFIILLLSFSPAYPEDYYDPQHTMLALNMAIVSVHRIITTQDRIVLDQEYQNIINNLSLGNIRSDPEITKLYEKLMDVASRRKLRANESDFITKTFNEQSKRSFSSALSDLGKKSITSGAFFGSLGNLITISAASYFKYQIGGTNLRGSLDENLYRLRAEDLADFNELQKQLLSSSWNLMSLYHIPDEYRLVQKSLDDFYRALNEPDTPSQKLRMLQALEDEFKVYPPYWYYRAKAAQENGDSYEAAKCFDEFDEVWRPVLRRDPYMLEAAKYRINELVKNGLPDDMETVQNIFSLCSVMRDNTMREDWVNNIFAGALYYALGEKYTGMKCIEINIDFDYEHELSNAVLSQMNENVPADSLFRDSMRLLQLNELTSGLEDSEKKLIFTLANYLDGKQGAVDALNQNRENPVILHALRINAVSKEDKSLFGELITLSESQPEISRDYDLFMPVLKLYADEGNSHALTFFADMYLYGWGVERDSELAMKYYRDAGEKGLLYAQFMYVNLLTAKKNFDETPAKIEIHYVPQSISVKIDSRDTKPTKQQKKPFIRFWPFK